MHQLMRRALHDLRFPAMVLPCLAQCGIQKEDEIGDFFEVICLWLILSTGHVLLLIIMNTK